MEPEGFAWREGSDRAAAKYQPDSRRSGNALCLSGGGYRAALFHLGALTRLNELGVLSRMDTISSVSGGSIVAALLADRIQAAVAAGQLSPRPPRGPLPYWEDQVAEPLRAFTRENIRTLWVLQLLLPGRWPMSAVAVKSLESRYHRDITQLTLRELPERPRFVFCATDLAFGVNWRSERRLVGDYQAGYAEPPPEWPVARAVAASSCFPPVFQPLPAGLRPEELKRGKAALRRDRRALVAGLRLSDGGVYDNMGLEPVWKDHELVLVSDGGATFDFAPDHGLVGRLGRYMSIVQNQASTIRKRWLMSSYVQGELTGAYWGIGSSPHSYDRSTPGYSPAVVDNSVSEVRTDLDAFSDAEQAILENHGYLLADAAIRTHAPALLPPGTPPPEPPHPDWMNEGRVRVALLHSSKRELFGRWRKAALPKRLMPEPASPETDALLKRWCPVVQYDSQESFYADAAAELTGLVVPASDGGQARASSLHRADGSLIASSAPRGDEPRLTLAFLGPHRYPGGQDVDRGDYLDAPGRNYVADARRLHADRQYADRVYGHARHDRRGRLWLQYWFFYYFNDKAFAGIGLHEGDWEMIQLRLRRGDTPEAATYAQHKRGQRAAWSDVEQADTEDGRVPVVYSARGSHASYFRAGTSDAPVGYDHNDGRGPRKRPELVVISDDGPGWALWPGFWGSTRAREIWESDSPRGPHEHGSWWDPDAFHAEAQALAPIPKGELAGVELASPPAPAISVRREGGHAAVEWHVGAPAPGQLAPSKLVLSLDGMQNGRPPATATFDITGRHGTVVHPLELEDRQYTVTASTVTGDARASATVREALRP
jgi:NTE family protein